MKALETLEKICEGIIRVLRVIMIVFILAMTAIIFANIVSRKFLNHAINWSDEAARYMMIYFVFFAGAIATYRDSHIVVDIVPNFMSRFKKFDYKIFINIVIVLTMIWFLRFSYTYLAAGFKTLQASPRLKIPVVYVQMITFAGPVLCIFFGIVATLRRAVNFYGKKEG